MLLGETPARYYGEQTFLFHPSKESDFIRWPATSQRRTSPRISTMGIRFTRYRKSINAHPLNPVVRIFIISLFIIYNFWRQPVHKPIDT